MAAARTRSRLCRINRPRYPVPMSFNSSGSSASSAVLEKSYSVRGNAARPPVRVKSMSRVRRSFAPNEIWGHYNNYRSNGMVGSAVFHFLALGAMLGGARFGHQVVQQAKPREVVTLIAPSPETNTLPKSKKEISGGGGGGDRDPLPAPKGRLPKPKCSRLLRRRS
jgi:hypothetical protein